MFKTDFSGHNKDLGGTAPNAPRGYGSASGCPALNRN